MTETKKELLLPAQSAQGKVDLPGSKSISNRVLLLAAISQGETHLDGLLDSDDTRVMLAALRRLGVSVESPTPSSAVVNGICPFPVLDADLFLGNAGTAIRPLTAVLALMGGDYRLSGVPRMHERPIGDLVDALLALGADIRYEGDQGFPPLRLGSGRLALKAGVSGDTVSVKGTVSSQFLTALLMAAPLHTAKTGRDLTINVQGELISQPYILITLNLMQRFGVQVQRDGWQRFIVPAAAAYRSPGRLHIEGDASSASYFMALGAIGGGPVRIQGVGTQSIQGDAAFADVVRQMGASVIKFDNAMEITGVHVAKGGRLKAFDRDFNLIPDAAMTAALMALFANGPCTLRNIASWRVKETDRIDAMHAELAKLGAQVESGPDWLRVHPMQPSQWRSADIHTYDDHRMAMCFSLASFGGVPLTILDPDCVAKTFPDYFSIFHRLVRE